MAAEMTSPRRETHDLIVVCAIFWVASLLTLFVRIGVWQETR